MTRYRLRLFPELDTPAVDSVPMEFAPAQAEDEAYVRRMAVYALTKRDYVKAEIQMIGDATYRWMTVHTLTAYFEIKES